MYPCSASLSEGVHCFLYRLILIAEKKTVYDKFPIPLINRLEKHFVLTSSVLTEWKLEVLQELEEWVHQFSRVSSAARYVCIFHRRSVPHIECYSFVVRSSKSFKECDAFIGYTKDTAAAVVFQATNQLERLRGEDLENSDEWKRMVATGCLKTIDPHGLIDEGEGTELWKQAVCLLHNITVGYLVHRLPFFSSLGPSDEPVPPTSNSFS